MPTRQLGARIDAALYKDVKRLAVEQDTSVAALLEEAVRMLLRKYERRTTR